MKRFLWAAASLSVVASSVWPISAVAARPRSDRPAVARSDERGKNTRVPGEVVVQYRSSTARTERAALRAATEARLIDSMPLARTEVVKVARRDVDETIAALESSPDVAFAEPNFYVHSFATPNDPRFEHLWGLNNTAQSVSGITGTADADIDAPEAWEVTTGSSATVVAIIDTGVAYDHPDLAGNIWSNPGEAGTKQANGVDDDGNGFTDDWRGWDWVEDDNKPRDFFGHGTHVAGIVGATGNDSYGGVGVSWDVSLMPLRVLDGEGVGTTADVAAAVNYAAANGADIINLSLGGPDFSLSVRDAIAAASGSLVVAASGNEADNVDLIGSYPCKYGSSNVVCVAATESNDTLAGYSNYGAVNVDLAAPGSRILSTVPAFARALQETFEADISTTWTAGGTGTQWSRGLDEFGYYAADSVDSNYQANTDSWLRTAAPISLAGQENCTLTYVFELDTGDDTDAFEVETSSDGTTWTHVGGFTGSTGGDWLTANHDLSAHDGTAVYLRFRFESNLVLHGGGVSIDDVQIKCLAPTFAGTEFSYFSGTSMAAPYVSGAAALLLSLVPDVSISTLRSALLGGADSLPALNGKVATGGRLNVNRALDVMGPTGLPLPGSSPSAEPSASPSSSHSSDPSPQPIPDPTDIQPQPDPTEKPATKHARSVTLRLRRHLVTRGRIFVPGGPTACLADQVVVIKRNGKVVKKARTAQDGRYIIRVRDRGGRYRARILRSELQGAVCLATRSQKVRHRH